MIWNNFRGTVLVCVHVLYVYVYVLYVYVYVLYVYVYVLYAYVYVYVSVHHHPRIPREKGRARQCTALLQWL